MAELVDALVSNTNAARRAGSIPALGTGQSPNHFRFGDFFVFLYTPQTTHNMKRHLLFLPLTALLFLLACQQQPHHSAWPLIDVLNPMTPVKNQGNSQSCWIYAMLAAIETEHISRGDSINLSPAWLEHALKREPQAPSSGRGMGATALSLLHRHGIVGFDAMRNSTAPPPRCVFMFGVEYTPQEFARSVCAPNEYVALTSTTAAPYGTSVVLNVADNWLRQRFLNIHPDTLLQLTTRAVSRGHGVCWESRGHAMAIVGLAHDTVGQRHYFVMKNSWGENRGNHGLEYLSYGYFLRHTLSVCMTRRAFNGD